MISLKLSMVPLLMSLVTAKCPDTSSGLCKDLDEIDELIQSDVYDEVVIDAGDLPLWIIMAGLGSLIIFGLCIPAPPSVKDRNNRKDPVSLENERRKQAKRIKKLRRNISDTEVRHMSDEEIRSDSDLFIFKKY